MKGRSLVDNGCGVYGDLLEKCDDEFIGNAMHGLARSCTSFAYEELAKIINQVPKDQLTEGDADNDLPVHSAIKSIAADARMVSLFVQGTPEQQKKILSSKNEKKKIKRRIERKI